jgi:hypothetical protein
MTDNRCPSCGAPFHCGAADTKPCWCVAVALDDAVRAALAAQLVGCLCAACLAAAQAGDAPAPGADRQARA